MQNVFVYGYKFSELPLRNYHIVSTRSSKLTRWLCWFICFSLALLWPRSPHSAQGTDATATTGASPTHRPFTEGSTPTSTRWSKRLVLLYSMLRICHLWRWWCSTLHIFRSVATAWPRHQVHQLCLWPHNVWKLSSRPLPEESGGSLCSDSTSVIYQPMQWFHVHSLYPRLCNVNKKFC